jgi:hypothetical protein
MISYERRVKMLTSAPFQFIALSLSFGLLNQGFNKTFSWVDVVLYGLPFGLIVTTITRIRPQNKYQVPTAEQIQLEQHLRREELPSNPEQLKAFSAYLAKRAQAAEKSKKQGLPLMAIFGLILLYLGYSSHKPIPIGYALFLLALAVANYYIITKAQHKIARLQKELQ